MKAEQFEQVLKWLDQWTQETHAVSLAQESLKTKLPFHRFERDLQRARALLRPHAFTAEDMADYDFSLEDEQVLVANVNPSPGA